MDWSVEIRSLGAAYLRTQIWKVDSCAVHPLRGCSVGWICRSCSVPVWKKLCYKTACSGQGRAARILGFGTVTCKCFERLQEKVIKSHWKLRQNLWRAKRFKIWRHLENKFKFSIGFWKPRGIREPSEVVVVFVVVWVVVLFLLLLLFWLLFLVFFLFFCFFL